MSNASAVPGSVKVIGVLAIVIGALQTIAGALAVIFSGSVDGYSTGAAIVYGLLTLVVGLVYVWVGRGLIRGDPSALLFALFVCALKLAYDVIWLIVLGIDGIGVGTLVSLIVNAVVLAILWGARSSFGMRPGTPAV